MYRKLLNALTIVVLLAGFFAVGPVSANPPAPDDNPNSGSIEIIEQRHQTGKPVDQPNMEAKLRLEERQRLLEEGKTAEAAALAQAGTDRVLVLLVEFAGTDVFTWNPGDQWDPLGIADPNEDTGTLGDCSRIITQTQTFTYTGPLHNEIARPISAADRSGDSIWTEDFSKEWFDSFMFKEGVVFDYEREDGSQVYEDFTGQSVADYYSDLSAGTYTVTGDILGWLPLPHSTYWYDADQCPGARSTSARPSRGGMIPGAGTSRDMVKDAAAYINAHPELFPGFDWADYDLDGDGVIDRLWIVHSGLGEEDSPTLLNRTDYGEGAVWSHSTSFTTPYEVAPGISIGAYIMMPENGGIGVFAHEYGHNLGADDLYSYAGGETSAGFWTLMADDWTGYPIGFEPPAVDPWHLDRWGWLNPLVITDTAQEYVFTLGQASEFPGGEGVYRGAKIELEDGNLPLAVPPWQGENYWWGGKTDLANAVMMTKDKVAIPSGASAAELTFDMAYEIEDEWDFLWVQASEDGATWTTLTNANMICTHDPSWVGELNGFPNDLCGAGIAGYSGHNTNFPVADTETIDLTALAGTSVYLRFWYMTDWGTTYSGPFIDSIMVTADGAEIFSDDGEAGDGKWVYEAADLGNVIPLQYSNGFQNFTHNFYLQWRNTNENGGYDSALGERRWRYGQADSGLLMWYNNNFYTDNEIPNYMLDANSIGPKGRALVIDSHPEPFRDPLAGYPNERGNFDARGQMRDAAFTLQDTSFFTLTTGTVMGGRPAVSLFHDSYGYYPGIELTTLTSTGVNSYYITKHWDASVVMPATGPYSVKGAADYPAGAVTDRILYRFEGGWYYLTPGGFGPMVGSGHPGDDEVQYGWHVELLSEAEDHTSATVKVWHAMKDVDATIGVDKPVAGINDNLEISFNLQENYGSPITPLVCVPLDTEMVEYVPASASPGALPQTTDCSAPTPPASPLAPSADEVIQSVVWQGSQFATSEGSAEFSFQVKPKQTGYIQPEAMLFDDGALFKTVVAAESTLIQPLASFEAPALAVVGEPVTFTNTSVHVDPIESLWDFGDGITSTLESPTHTFTTEGTFTVTLQASVGDSVDTAMTTIVVGYAPEAVFTASATEIMAGESITFTNASEGTAPLSYLWDFGDEITSTLTSPVHAFETAGTYTVTLTTTSEFGESVATLEIIVDPWFTVFMPLTNK